MRDFIRSATEGLVFMAMLASLVFMFGSVGLLIYELRSTLHKQQDQLTRMIYVTELEQQRARAADKDNQQLMETAVRQKVKTTQLLTEIDQLWLYIEQCERTFDKLQVKPEDRPQLNKPGV